MINMPRQFYSEKTNASLELMHNLTGNIDFVLIGGWAVHMYLGSQRSMDIDLTIDYPALDYFRRYGIEKYDGININYSIINGVTVDIFLPGFSDKDLPFPVNEILSNYVIISNVKVVKKEMLLLLKLWGYFSNDETKIRKDIIDVTSLLLYGDVDLTKVKDLIRTHNLQKRRTTDVMLEYLDKGRALAQFICEDPNDYSKLAEKCKSKISFEFDY